MKYKIILLIGFLFVASIFALCTKRTTYFSNSGDQQIKEKLFHFTCKLAEGDKYNNRLAIAFDFFNTADQHINQFAVLPIVNGKDTLRLESNHAGLYNFTFPKAQTVDRLDVILNYKVDSAGFMINKSAKYFQLEKMYTYNFRTAFH